MTAWSLNNAIANLLEKLGSPVR